jgi:CelD/BcsL family acetyltransferase involved in cellulose biosynthesis
MIESDLTIERISDIASLHALEGVWNTLLKISATKSAELTYEWQMFHWQNFHKDSELFVLIVKRTGSIVAIAPLKLIFINILGLKIRRLEIIAALESNYQDLVIGENDDEILNCIFDYLVGNLKSWDLLSLRHIPETSPTISYLSEKLNRYDLNKLTITDKCIYLHIDKSWEDYKKDLGKNRKHRMANRARRIEREVGPLKLKNCLTNDEFLSEIQIFFELHNKRWNQTDTPSQFMDERYRKFYIEAGVKLFEKGQLGLSVLVAGGKTLSSLIFFTYDKNSLIQLIAYDPDYYPYSPMLVLQEMFVEDSLLKGADEIDWGTYYSWKELWANQIKNRANLEIFSKRLIPYIFYEILKTYRMIKKNLVQNPRVLDFARHLRNRIGLLEKESKKEVD